MPISRLMCLAALSGVTACASTAQAPLRVAAPPQIEDASFRAGAARVAATPGAARARNVILFIGDGMGVATVTAARIYAGQRQGLDGESYDLAMDTFPHLAHSRTYADDAQISDSAPTATALLSGVKTRTWIIGLTREAEPNVCEAGAHHARTLLEIAEEAGLRTGVVTTARLTHATPAATYAHVAGRDWENDVIAARANAGACGDIARQFIEWPAGDGLEIALGGGRANFLPNTATDPEDATVRGARGDARDLTAEWAARPGHVYAWNAQQLAQAPPDARVLGLFAPSHMAYESERASDAGGEPSLADMTAAAIQRLSADDRGYVLMVEGGRIDHAHHDGRAGQALSETVAFDDAIRTALEMTGREDTLIMVTADHSHTLTISGYAARGNPILGLSQDGPAPARAADNLPYTTLGYANGPGAVLAPARNGRAPAPATRPDLSNVDTQALEYRAQALTPMAAETHGGEDVAIYAWGPSAPLVSGTMEENAVFHVAIRALGITW